MGDVQASRKQSLQMAGVVAGSAVALNALFWVMSSMYFTDKPKLAHVDVGAVRSAFAAMSFVIAAATYAAGFAPRMIGHGIAVLIGVASLIGGVAGLMSALPNVLGVTLLACGVLLPLLAVYSLKLSRPAWAFLLTTLAVLATVTFFGAPKIRHMLDISLWFALIIPGLQIVAVVALSMVRGEYHARA